MLDEEEFLSPFGIRSCPARHTDHPYVLAVGGTEHRVGYEPGESSSGLFGGNSNWRGPVWFPAELPADRIAAEVPPLPGRRIQGGMSHRVSGRMMTLWEVAAEISRRLSRLLLRDDDGRRPVNGANECFHTDPHWRDLVLFHEYFHGDTGAGLGASHQTGLDGPRWPSCCSRAGSRSNDRQQAVGHRSRPRSKLASRGPHSASLEIRPSKIASTCLR